MSAERQAANIRGVGPVASFCPNSSMQIFTLPGAKSTNDRIASPTRSPTSRYRCVNFPMERA
eukprot:1417563-Amphidinium_carterae.1